MVKYCNLYDHKMVVTHISFLRSIILVLRLSRLNYSTSIVRCWHILILSLQTMLLHFVEQHFKKLERLEMNMTVSFGPLMIICLRQLLNWTLVTQESCLSM